MSLIFHTQCSTFETRTFRTRGRHHIYCYVRHLSESEEFIIVCRVYMAGLLLRDVSTQTSYPMNPHSKRSRTASYGINVIQECGSEDEDKDNREDDKSEDDKSEDDNSEYDEDDNSEDEDDNSENEASDDEYGEDEDSDDEYGFNMRPTPARVYCPRERVRMTQ